MRSTHRLRISLMKRPTRFFVLALLLAGMSAVLSIFSVAGAQLPSEAQQTCSVNCTASAAASGSTGQPISFTASATATGCATSPSYQWSFGDGGTSTQQNPTHAYANGGNYTGR
jgi:hypothetical protein